MKFEDLKISGSATWSNFISCCNDFAENQKKDKITIALI